MLPLPFLRAAAFLWSALLSLVPFIAPPALLTDGAADAADGVSGEDLLDPIVRSPREPLEVTREVVEAEPVPEPPEPEPVPAEAAEPPVELVESEPEPEEEPAMEPQRPPTPPDPREKYSLSFATPEADVFPGGLAHYLLDVVNNGGANLTVNLSTSRVQPGWAAVLGRDTVTVDPLGRTTIAVVVRAPDDAKDGDEAPFVIRAWSVVPEKAKFAGALAKVEGPVLPPYAVKAGFSPSKQGVDPDGEVTYELHVTNRGAKHDAYELLLNGTTPLGWVVALEEEEVALAPGASTLVKVTVKAPAFAGDGHAADHLVEVRSKAEPSVRSLTLATTTVHANPAGLPATAPPVPLCERHGEDPAPVATCDDVVAPVVEATPVPPAGG